ncbi:uncharacterized protein LOC126369102 [Pectinophora gossypiella]|uniref:uncharacterized protein LOC126369102 n=1 Tax=Pectinophora gossypiella TaxID=13191 RepID=UPI00214E49F7|nr:uncharacterized protein LOC126369102 [Pectinophora gossypiella]
MRPGSELRIRDHSKEINDIVKSIRNEFYVYSAFVERHRKVGVRVIAIINAHSLLDDVICRIWMPDGRVLTLKARVKVVPENLHLNYNAAYVLCDIHDTGVESHETEGAALAVIASEAADRTPTNFLNVINPFPDSEDYLSSLHVCVKPFDFSYHRVDWMIEWIELNRLLGVSHFYMYNDSVSDQMECLLRYYARQGLITVLPWNMPISHDDIRTTGQNAAFNDCLYRSKSTAGWLLIIDTDEVVMPRQEDNLTALLNSLNKNYSAPDIRIGAFMFRNVYFYLGLQDDPESPVPLLTSRKTRRMLKPTPLPERAKYIVRPGNHLIWRNVTGAAIVHVPEEDALLHHYRENCVDTEPCALVLDKDKNGQDRNVTEHNIIVDRTAHRWANKLWKRVVFETSNLRYSPAYVLCDMRRTGVEPHETQGAALAVIASMAANKPPTNFLTVINSFPDSKVNLSSLHVCVKPLHFSYHRVTWMIEWIELNRLLGVSHFYMYNDSVSGQMDCILRYYVGQGLVTLLPWNIPISVSDGNLIKIRGQQAAFNDCVLRSMSTAAWLLIIDTDEVVMPRLEDNLTALLDSFSKIFGAAQPRVGGYLFRNVFFYLGWQDDPESPMPLLTSLKTRRMTYPTPWSARTKYVVRPVEVIEPGNHFIWTHAPGATTLLMPENQALLHHYREKCLSGSCPQVDMQKGRQKRSKLDDTIVDRTAHRWTQKLWKNSWRNRTKRFESEDVQQDSPGRLPQDGVWQPVYYTKRKFYVYSAFLERAAKAVVRVIAITITLPPYDSVICRMWLPDDRVITLSAQVQMPKIQIEKRYSATFVLCNLRDTGIEPHEAQGASLAVMASTAADRPPSNLHKVIDSFPKHGSDIYRNSLHVCVSSFHLSYDRVDWMVEWIEMNRLLGVSHFYMYEGSVTDQVSCLLSHYQRQGLLTLFPWNLPGPVKHKISTRAQVAALNDCLYRSMSTTGWLLVTDTDELVIPRHHSNLTTLLDSFTKTYTSKHKTLAGLVFKNFFYFLGFEDDPNAPVPLITSRKTRRMETPNLQQRTKYAVRPLEIIETGVHEVFQHTPGVVIADVSAEQAPMHHYRVKFIDNDPNIKQLLNESTVDRTALRWSKDLWRRVKAKLQNIQCQQAGKLQLNRPDSTPSTPSLRS